MQRFRLKVGDLLVCEGGEIGRAAIWNDQIEECYYQKTLHRLRPIYGYNVYLMLCFFQYWVDTGFLSNFVTQTSIAHLTKEKLKDVSLPVPSEDEQKTIAKALSETDALIGSLEQLIAKKRHIKQGAMQELLCPTEEDDEKKLIEISTLKGRIGWQGLKQTEFTSNDDEPFLITGMNFKDGAIQWEEVYHISEERYEIAKEIQLKPDDVLMTKDGTIGKMLYVDKIPHPEKASLNSHLLLFRPIGNSYHPKFLYYQLNSKRFKDFVELNKSGTTFFGILQESVGNYPFLLPSMKRQIQIATILSDMDTAIAVLEEKLTKTRQLKQGMMHELLTGRIRLVD
jgi:type I restriction enzyme, S subunit